MSCFYFEGLRQRLLSCSFALLSKWRRSSSLMRVYGNDSVTFNGYIDNKLKALLADTMATLEQKSPNVLLQSLCCRITGKSEGTVSNIRKLRANVNANNSNFLSLLQLVCILQKNMCIACSSLAR